MSALRVAVILAGLLIVSSPAFSRTWQILNDGSGNAPTIQAGIDSAATSDSVLVGSGVYTENLDFLGKRILVKSRYGPIATVIDGSRAQAPVVSFTRAEGHSAILEGFRITGGKGLLGRGAGGLGGGVYIEDSEPTIRDNVIEENGASNASGDYGFGGGIYCEGTEYGSQHSPIIENNVIRKNSAVTNGGGIGSVNWVAPIIVGNTISENVAEHGDGGGIWILGTTNGTIIANNEIRLNLAGDHGGGIYCAYGLSSGTLHLEIAWNRVIGNTANSESGVDYAGGGLWLFSADAWVHQNDIVGNQGGLPWQFITYGGGIVVLGPSTPVVERNIIAFSVNGGGVTCDSGASPILKDNLVWKNFMWHGWGPCTGDGADWWTVQGNVEADPLFCEQVGSPEFSGALAVNSPALAHSAGPLGAFPIPGCGAVAVQVSTWGALKARYH